MNPEAANALDEYEEFFGEPDLATVGQFRGMPVTQKMSGARRDYHREIRDKMGDPTGRIRIESNQSVGWKRESSKKKRGTWTMPSKSKSKAKIIGEDEAIIDADYENVYKTTSPRDARDLGLPERSKRSTPKRENPPAMRAISDRKRATVSEINELANPSTKRKPSLVKSRDLVDDAFDEVVK